MAHHKFFIHSLSKSSFCNPSLMIFKSSPGKSLCPFSTKCLSLEVYTPANQRYQKIQRSLVYNQRSLLWIYFQLTSPCDIVLQAPCCIGLKLNLYIDVLILTNYLFNTRCVSSMPGRCRHSHQKPYQLFKVKHRLVRNRLRYPMGRQPINRNSSIK